MPPFRPLVIWGPPGSKSLYSDMETHLTVYTFSSLYDYIDYKMNPAHFRILLSNITGLKRLYHRRLLSRTWVSFEWTYISGITNH